MNISQQSNSVIDDITENENEIVNVLCKLISEVLGVEVRPDEHFSKLGLNSLHIIQLTKRLEELFGFRDPVIFYSAHTVRDLIKFISARVPNIKYQLPSSFKISPSSCSSDKSGNEECNLSNNDVAIIGVSGRYPQADNLAQFESLLAQGKDCIEEVPEAYRSPGNDRRWGGFLSQTMNFDFGHFNMSYREALITHPEERLLLEETWRCFESAGYKPTQWVNAKSGDIGVYIGASFHEYSELITESNQHNSESIPHSSQIFGYANRISHFYNLSGPSVALDCACSSSLYAILDAYNSIRFGLCEMALAGGVNLNLHRSKYDFLQDKNALSQDGRCRSFAEGGTGYVPSEGVGVILMKSLTQAMDDNDNILAVIKGGAAGNDGRTQGFTVPNPEAQRDIIRKAFEVANISTQSISFVECHGTGTSLGDPIEISALSEAFETGILGRCPISSVKSNIGHLEAAAGIAQITKVLLQFKRKQYFPTVMHHKNLNPNIDFRRTPFIVQKELSPWLVNKTHPNRRAGISSFGAGGTNVHLILEQAPESKADSITDEQMDLKYIIPFSGVSPEHLVSMVNEMYCFIRDEQSLLNPGLNVRNIAATLQHGRCENRYRLAIICDNSLSVLIARLKVYLDGHVDSTMLLGESKQIEYSELMGISISMTEILAIAKNWTLGGIIFQHDPGAQRINLPTFIFRSDLVKPKSICINDTYNSSNILPDSVKANEIIDQQLISPDTLELVRCTLTRILGSLPKIYSDNMQFSDLGIDSILMGRIHTELLKTFPNLDMFAFYEFNSASLLSEHLSILGSANCTESMNDIPKPKKISDVETDDVGEIGVLEFGNKIVPFKKLVDAYHGWVQASSIIQIEDVFVNGSRVECVICGEGPTLVLLPPFNSNAMIWIHQLHSLSNKFTVVVPHYPGFSRSEWIDGLDHFNDLSDILIRAIDELVVKQFIPQNNVFWVGWSLGGFIAQTICQRHPEYVRKLVLISTTTVSWSSKEYTITAEEFSIKCAEEFETNFSELPMFLQDMPEIKKFRQEGHIERFVWCTTNRRILECYFRMIARFRNADAGQYVRANTLLISGSDDELMPAKYARELKNKIQNSVYKEINGGHHFLSLFHYRSINKLLNQWFSE